MLNKYNNSQNLIIDGISHTTFVMFSVKQNPLNTDDIYFEGIMHLNNSFTYSNR